MKRKILALIFLLISTITISSAQTSKQQSVQKINADDLDYRKDGNGYLLVLKAGQPVIASLNAFLEKEKLPGASFSGIGAIKNAEVGYYNIDLKKYVFKTFEPSVEVLAFNGNMGYFEGKPVMHPHIAFGSSDYTVHGGHLREAVVSLVLEIFIVPTTKPITREWSQEFPELRTMKPVKE